MILSTLSLIAISACTQTLQVAAFLTANNHHHGKKVVRQHHRKHDYSSSSASTPQLFLFDKLFEEEGTLGKGITVGKISVALRSPDRSSDTSIFGLLESHAADDSDANQSLARMANNVCLDLMRKSDDWVAACSSSKWFSGKDAGKAEGYYNDLSNNEAIKFEKVRWRGVPLCLILCSRQDTNIDGSILWYPCIHFNFFCRNTSLMKTTKTMEVQR
jgi:Protein of unknown function (DUF1517)